MDTLYLLENEFEDAELAGRRFYCRDCMLLNGLLSAFPERTKQLNVVRVAHAPPRNVLIQALGEDNQWLPVLVLANDAPDALATAEYRGTRFVKELPALLAALHVRHGFPEAHP